MELFTNSDRSKIYTRNGVGLEVIKIESITDFVRMHRAAPKALIGLGELLVYKDGELITVTGMKEDEAKAVQDDSEVFEFDFGQGLTRAEQAKHALNALTFSEQIDLLGSMRIWWDFDDDYEENTEWIDFTAEDGSNITVGINGNERTVSCEIVA